MRSQEEEREAMLELIRRAQVYKAPDADAEVAAHLGHRPRMLANTPVWPGTDMPTVCMLFRGKPQIPGNRVGRCDECHDPIQWRPQLDKRLRRVKVCAFCALRHVRGDA